MIGFWENSYHDTQEHWKSVNIHVSTGLVGVASADRDGWKTYDWCSINLNLEKPSRSIYYNGNGGDGADVTWNFTDGDYFSFPTVSRRGYTLEGWLDEGTKWMSNAGWLVCDNYTETAQWTANTYTVNYDGNGEDSGYVNDGTATYDQNYRFAENGYTKKGYAFVGWNTDKHAVRARYSPEETITWSNTEGMTLYAVWSKNSYEVTFDGNGASGSKKTVELKYGQDDILPAIHLNGRDIPSLDGVKIRMRSKQNIPTDRQLILSAMLDRLVNCMLSGRKQMDHSTHTTLFMMTACLMARSNWKGRMELDFRETM